jgi:hypothetical protein
MCFDSPKHDKIPTFWIEQGRHQNIPLENRLCPICKLEIENEYHFVIECNKLTSSRSKLYSKVTDIVPNFLVMSDSDKFKYILNSTLKNLIIKYIGRKKINILKRKCHVRINVVFLEVISNQILYWYEIQHRIVISSNTITRHTQNMKQILFL